MSCIRRFGALLILLGCPTETTTPDAGPLIDTGTVDAGDTGSNDTGAPDAGTNDSGMQDDAGDAGPFPCPELVDDLTTTPTSGMERLRLRMDTLRAGTVRLIAPSGDPLGGVYVAGEAFGAMVDVGGFVLRDEVQPASIGFVANFGRDGVARFAVPIVGPDPSDLDWRSPSPMVAAGGPDAVYVASRFAEPFSLGSQTVTATAGFFIARVANGVVDWLNAYPGTAEGNARVWADEAGVVVTIRDGDSPGATLRQLDPAGTLDGSRCIDTSGNNVNIAALTRDSAGAVYASFFPFDAYDVGLGLTPIDSTRGASVIVKIGADRTTLWSREMRGAYADFMWMDTLDRLYTFGHVPQIGSEVVLVDERVATCDEGFQYHVTRISPDGTRDATRVFSDLGVQPVGTIIGRFQFFAASGMAISPNITLDDPSLVVMTSTAVLRVQSLGDAGNGRWLAIDNRETSFVFTNEELLIFD